METTQFDNRPSKGLSIGLAVLLGLLGLAAGFGVAKLTDMDKTADTNQTAVTPVAATTDTKAADLRVVLNALEREHVDLASQATRAGFDGRADFTAAAGQLDKNSKELQAAVASVYGEEAGNKFYQIWNSHIGFFVDYTVAAKKGDKAGMDKAVTNLNGYVEAISDFFSGANPNLPKEAVKQLVSEHVLLLKGAVDAYGAKNYPQSYAKEHEANVQIGKIADALAGAIVKQNPSKF